MMLCLSADTGTGSGGAYDEPMQLRLPIHAYAVPTQPRPAPRRFRKAPSAPQLPIVWAPRIDRNALILKYEPVARAVAAKAFDRCKGKGAGLEGKGPGGLLPALQQEALYELTLAAQDFNPARIAPTSGKPVSFAPYARSRIKWSIHHFLKGGRRPLPKTEDLTDRAIELAEEAPDMDAAERYEVRAAVAALEPALQEIAARVLNDEADELDREEMRTALEEFAPRRRAAPRPVPQRGPAKRPAEDTITAPLIHAQAPAQRRGGTALW